MNNKIDYLFPILKKNTLFYDNSNDEIENKLNYLDYSVKDYKKGDFVHFAGNRIDKFGLVAKGKVNVFTDDIEGNRTLMAEVLPGNTFGESICLLNNESTDIYIIAVEDCKIVWLSCNKLFSGNTDDTAQSLENAFAKMLAKRTLLMNNRIQILSKLTLRYKIITYLTFLSHKSSYRVEIPFNREDMATYFGTNRTALSRELSKMKAEGLIDYQKNIFTLKFKKN